MSVFEKSFFYQESFKKGYEKGYAKGWREGFLPELECALERKFGCEGLKLMSEISQISDLEQLKAIYRGVLKINTLREVDELIRSLQISST
ncbi:hypothetical protein [Nostoc sp. CHAB 5715]|uniref:hypothetical protein n=1 Tax=Nostoc sp. CHAB 5715 TaxID=2780400 RepID=UPI001E3AF806|nr:hypothetical protein [Nostoc sp. CHAB 5715]MCC5622222.1 hypothetical protein [Nostoc sp. CHAB 5715]